MHALYVRRDAHRPGLGLSRARNAPDDGIGLSSTSTSTKHISWIVIILRNYTRKAHPSPYNHLGKDGPSLGAVV
ncbi:hypothetical protein CY34DRAFT_808483 [Suillus luteus UH-Slu-Lm8-n1]|uniref:Uncharacterized protein n=1 Tax=Suillus luteus UH-Slu-Lm8-n1 TaxID=930992 RepID=A0A0D0AY20_9AGAM|nr:hypothetical protein CY34DRAFT_808483 [Suillus luteus UH-Slu-Lm8-n1]